MMPCAELRCCTRLLIALALAAGCLPSQSAGEDRDDEKPKPPRTKTPAIVLTSVVDLRAAANRDGFVLRYGVKHADVEKLRAAVSNIARVVLLHETRRKARYVGRSCNVRVIGTTANAPAVIALSFKRGGFFGKRQVQTRNNVAVIGAAVARSLFQGIDPVGRNVRIGPNYFLVTGVLKPTGARKNEADFDSAVFIPLTTMQSRVNLDNLDVSRKAGTFTARQVELTQVLIAVPVKTAIRETAESIREYFEKFHKAKDVEVGLTVSGKR